MTSAPATLDDSTLIKLTIAGHVEAFAALMDRHIAAVRRRIFAMVRSADDTDDLLQEVQLRVWRHLSAFRWESTFRTWIIRIAINEVLQSLRRQKRKGGCQPLIDLNILRSREESPHQSVVRIETAETVRRAVAKLPTKYRQVLILRDLREFTERQTAHSLELSIPAVKTRLLRARHMLSKELRGSTNGGLERVAA